MLSGFIINSQVNCASPVGCTIIPRNITYYLRARGGKAWKGAFLSYPALSKPKQQWGQILTCEAGSRVWVWLGLCQEPIRLANIPWCSLCWLSRQGVSRHLLSQLVSSLGGKYHPHIPSDSIRYRWCEGFCHLAELLADSHSRQRGGRLSKDNEWL